MLSVRKKLTIDQFIFLLGIFIKQFYFLPSGSLQVGDILMLLSAGWTLLFRTRGKIQIRRDEYYFLVFFAFLVVINFLYSVIDGVSAYNKSSIYYFFNTIVIILFSYNIHNTENDEYFLNGMLATIKLSLLTQMLLLVSGIGKWYSGIRYEGSFNDPNQYGVFIFFCILIIYLLGSDLKKLIFPWIILGILLILPSSSTGMMVGILFFSVSFLAFEMIETRDKTIIIWMLLVIALFIVYQGLSNGVIELPSFITSNRMYTRFFSKVNKILNQETEGSLLTDRGWARIIDNRQYLLYGAGEGNHERFNVRIEVHSSFFGPLFYYGIVPCSFLVRWIAGNLRNLDKRLICVYVGLFAESIFLINTRQPLFWIIYLLGSYRLSKKDKVYRVA